ncbi:response regulator transcription factor [Segetibacter koreensis]|uniref:response regulator transcription factor n=1 Tax=Segetibacter koreensis TaxID=398037 RepID=UPI00039BED14|nr:response regulator [Segetibacter koreensis]
MKPVILIVDDNVEILEFIADFLDEDYATIKAFDGQEALNVLQREPVQLVITDIMMPGMDGYELCEKIKTNFEYSHIPVILLTSKNTFQSKIVGLEIGADAYIEKPFSPQHLQLQISNLLLSRNKIKEYFASSPLVHIKGLAYTKADENFLRQLNDIINENIENVHLDVVQVAKLMNMSRPTLYRKIKEISNVTPNEIINITRLKKAAELLVEGEHSINQISEIVGYTSQTVFAKTFQKQFGMTPSEYVRNKLKDRVKFN